jgi:hypothetical protein
LHEIQPALDNKEDHCGGCYVGRVNLDAQLAAMGDILAKVRIHQSLPYWNSHAWVEVALRRLGNSGFGINCEKLMWLRHLQQSMLYELENWPGIGPGIEFVSHKYLECVTESKIQSELWKLERRGQK